MEKRKLSELCYGENFVFSEKDSTDNYENIFEKGIYNNSDHTYQIKNIGTGKETYYRGNKVVYTR